MNVAGDVTQIVLNREVTGIEPVHFRFGRSGCYRILLGPYWPLH